MTEIEFRAWHQDRNRHFHVDSIMFTDGLIHLEYWDDDRCDWDYIEEHLKDVTLEQFTGKVDKNGKPIYVGDIVEISFTFAYAEKYEVESIFEFAQWEWQRIETIEVIGNKHRK